MFRKLTIFASGASDRPATKWTACPECGCIYFVCDENRDFTCERCGRPFVVQASQEIDDMFKLTVYLNENEPIIGPAILERLPREA